MTAHLPECGRLTPDDVPCQCRPDHGDVCYHRCICDALRRCEDRVRADEQERCAERVEAAVQTVTWMRGDRFLMPTGEGVVDLLRVPDVLAAIRQTGKSERAMRRRLRRALMSNADPLGVVHFQEDL